MYTFVSKYVISVSDISAINVIVGWKLFAICLSPCVRYEPTTRPSSGRNFSRPRWWCCWSTWNAKPVMKFVLGVNIRRPSARSPATSAPTFIWRVRWKISKSTNHSSDYACDVIWRQRLRTTESFCHWFCQTNRPDVLALYWKSRILGPRFHFFKSTSSSMFHCWPSFDLFLCSLIDMCGFDIYVSGFVPVCTVRPIFHWFDCDLCKLESFAFGSIYFEAFDLLFADRFIFAQFNLYLCKLDLFARVSICFWPFNNVCTRFILFVLWLEDFGRNGAP